METFKPDDLVWFATTPKDATDENPAILLHGIVKDVKRNGHLITVQWSNGTMDDHLANNLTFTAEDAIQKYTDWIKTKLRLQYRHDF